MGLCSEPCRLSDCHVPRVETEHHRCGKPSQDAVRCLALGRDDGLLAGHPCDCDCLPGCTPPPVHVKAEEQESHLLGCLRSCLQRPKGLLRTWCKCPVLRNPRMDVYVCVDSAYVCTVNVLVLDWTGTRASPTGSRWWCCIWTCPTSCAVYRVCPCQRLPHPVASRGRRSEPAASGHGVKRERWVARCPRLLEQRPNRGVLSSCRESTGWTPPTSNSDGARRWLPIRGPWQL